MSDQEVLVHLIHSRQGRVIDIKRSDHQQNKEQLNRIIEKETGIPVKQQVLLLKNGRTFHKFERDIFEYELYMFSTVSIDANSQKEEELKQIKPTQAASLENLSILDQSALSIELENLSSERMVFANSKSNEIKNQNYAISAAIRNLQYYFVEYNKNLKNSRSKFDELKNSFMTHEKFDIKKLQETELHPALQKTFGKKTLIDLITHDSNDATTFITNLKDTIKGIEKDYSTRESDMQRIEEQQKEMISSTENISGLDTKVQSILNQLTEIIQKQKENTKAILENATNTRKEEEVDKILRNHISILKDMISQDFEANSCCQKIVELKHENTLFLDGIIQKIATLQLEMVKVVPFAAMNCQMEELTKLITKLEYIVKFETNHYISILEMMRREQWKASILTMMNTLFREECERRNHFKDLVGKCLGKINPISKVLNNYPYIDYEASSIHLDQLPNLDTIDMGLVLHNLGGIETLISIGFDPQVFKNVTSVVSSSSELSSSADSDSQMKDEDACTNNKSDTKLLSLAREIEQLVAYKNKLERNIAQLREEQEKENKRHSEDKKMLQELVQKLQTENRELNAVVTNTQKDKELIMKLSDENSKLNETTEYLLQENQKKSLYNQALQNENASLKQQFFDLNQQYSAAVVNNDYIRSMKNDYQQLANKLRMEIEQNAKLQMNYSNLNNLYCAIQEQLQQVKDNLVKEKNKNQNYESSSDQLKSAIDKKDNEIQQLRTKLSTESEQVQNLSKDVTNLKKSLGMMSQQLQQKTGELDEAKRLIKQQNERNQAIQLELEAKKNRIEELLKDFDTLNEAQKIGLDNCAVLSSQNEVLQGIMSDLVEKLKEMASFLTLDAYYYQLDEISRGNNWENLAGVIKELTNGICARYIQQ